MHSSSDPRLTVLVNALRDKKLDDMEAQIDKLNESNKQASQKVDQLTMLLRQNQSSDNPESNDLAASLAESKVSSQLNESRLTQTDTSNKSIDSQNQQIATDIQVHSAQEEDEETKPLVEGLNSLYKDRQSNVYYPLDVTTSAYYQPERAFHIIALASQLANCTFNFQFIKMGASILLVNLLDIRDINTIETYAHHTALALSLGTCTARLLSFGVNEAARTEVRVRSEPWASWLHLLWENKTLALPMVLHFLMDGYTSGLPFADLPYGMNYLLAALTIISVTKFNFSYAGKDILSGNDAYNEDYLGNNKLWQRFTYNSTLAHMLKALSCYDLETLSADCYIGLTHLLSLAQQVSLFAFDGYQAAKITPSFFSSFEPTQTILSSSAAVYGTCALPSREMSRGEAYVAQYRNKMMEDMSYMGRAQVQRRGLLSTTCEKNSRNILEWIEDLIFSPVTLINGALGYFSYKNFTAEEPHYLLGGGAGLMAVLTYLCYHQAANLKRTMDIAIALRDENYRYAGDIIIPSAAAKNVAYLLTCIDQVGQSLKSSLITAAVLFSGSYLSGKTEDILSAPSQPLEFWALLYAANLFLTVGNIPFEKEKISHTLSLSTFRFSFFSDERQRESRGKSNFVFVKLDKPDILQQEDNNSNLTQPLLSQQKQPEEISSNNNGTNQIHPPQPEEQDDIGLEENNSCWARLRQRIWG